MQLFNFSLSLGEFTDTWEIARVVRISKGGATDDKSNYKPISLLPVISRVFKRLNFDLFYNYLQ